MSELVIEIILLFAGMGIGYGLRIAHKPDRTPVRGSNGRFQKRK